jgi:hypothetical protein
MADGSERRVKARRNVNLRVWADPGGVLPVVDCRIIDISDEGAQVVSVKGIALPDVFTMQVDSSRLLGEAHVVWRKRDSVGVRFAKQKAE